MEGNGLGRGEVSVGRGRWKKMGDGDERDETDAIGSFGALRVKRA
jgi:hypothetical protein